MLFMIYHGTETAVKYYLEEGIVNIIEEFNISHCFASVTLQAFSNGVGDLLTAMVTAPTADGKNKIIYYLS